MSYKAGIPLLHSFEDADDDDDDELTMETVIQPPRRRCSRRHACFWGLLAAGVALVAVFIVAVLVPVILTSRGGATTPTPTPTPTPTCANGGDVCSSTFDPRQYKYFQLGNELRVVLVSDPQSSLAAASMEVSAGSFSDPPSAQGLAHFCEHMLFLGTEKYPDKHEYSQFLTSHGGGDNAFTSTQNTNYYFSVQSDSLKEALDRFAQFFIAPLFSPSSVNDEIHAVNAEHKKNLQSDGWRQWQLLKYVSNPSHPFSQFSTGTIGTLNHSGLLDQLHQYYSSSYSANTMFLAIYGRDSIETLTDWTAKTFSAVPNRQLSPRTFDSTSFPTAYAGKIVHYYTVADQHTLSILWQVPALQNNSQSDAASFITRYLGYEGNGSILHLLQSRGLARSLSAGTEFDADSYSLLEVTVELTSRGLGEVSTVVKTVVQFIAALSGSSDERSTALWEDHVAVAQTGFDFGEVPEPDEYVQTISQTMRTAALPADYLAPPSRLRLDLALHRDVLVHLTPKNSLIFIGSQRYNVSGGNVSAPAVDQSNVPENGRISWPTLSDKEPIYGTPFSKDAIPDSLADFWSQKDEGLDLRLPEANTFVVSSLELLPLHSNGSGRPESMETEDTTGVALWWLQDAEFREKRVNIRCAIESQFNTSDVTLAAALELYATMVTYLLQSQLYAPKEVGYDYTVSATARGLQLKLTGLSDPDNMAAFVATVASGLVDESRLLSNPMLLQLAFEEVTEELSTYNFTTLPFRYSYKYLQRVVMERPYWKHWQLLASVTSLNVSQVVSSVSDALFSNSTLLCLAHGNLNASLAASYLRPLASALEDKLTGDSAEVIGHFWRERVNLTEPGNYSVALPTLNPEDENSVINVLYQTGSVCDTTASVSCSRESIIRRAHLYILSQIIADECFYELRTKQQLGYVAFCFPAFYLSVGSFQVVVQSEEYSADEVLERIDAFVCNYSSSLHSLTPHAFTAQVSLLTETLLRRKDTFTALTDALWGEIATGQMQFTVDNQTAAVLQENGVVTADSVAAFFDSHIVDSLRYRKLVLAVYGTGKEPSFESSITHPLNYTDIDQSSSDLP